MKRFFPYFTLLKPLRWKFIAGILAGAIAAFASGFGLPFMTKEVFPLIFRSEESGAVVQPPDWMGSLIEFFGLDPASVTAVTVFACCLLPIVFLVRGVFGYINIYLTNWVGLKVLEAIRLQVFDRLQRLSLSFHQRHKDGDILTRVMGDTAQLQTVIVRVSNDLVVQPFTLLSAVGYLVYAAVTDSKVFFILIALLSLPACIIPIRVFGKKLYRKARFLQAKTGDMTAAVAENLACQQEVRAYNMQDQQVSWVESLSQQFLRFQMGVIKYRYLISPAVEIVAATGISFAIYYGARNGMTLESFISLAIALHLAYEPIKKVGTIHSLIKQGEASLERLEDILHSDEEIKDASEPVEIKNVSGAIAMHHVTFSYGDHVALSDINVAIDAGQTVALVGPSGAGKSTFASLIPRFYEVDRGEVTIDGVNVSAVKKKDLRQQIALVSQHPLLFRGSIEDNIRIGNPAATRDQIIEAARKAHAHEFISRQPEQYDTQVGERGEGLSGGQKQRVAISRAFLKDAPILIMDEATSALDTESEAQIQAQLQELARGRTTLIIAHRFSTIKIADRILVFDKGHIIADGPHEEIYQSCMLYKDLYDQQSGEEHAS
ncbi:MAG: ABC transporter ATP-binding protein [Akkermansiaceae bacterium]